MTIYDPQEYDDPPTPSMYERWVPGHGWELIPTIPPNRPYVRSKAPLPAWRVAQGFYRDETGLHKREVGTDGWGGK